MRALSVAAAATKFADKSPLLRGTFSIRTRTEACFSPRRLLFFRVKCGGSTKVDELHDFKVVPSTVLATEKEEAKAILILFLKKQGLSSAITKRTISKSDRFINHLVSGLHRIYKGRELTMLKIRDAIIPYLEYLLEEYGDSLVDVMESFPNPPEKERDPQASPTNLALDMDKQKTLNGLTEVGTDGQLPPLILYLIDIGLDMDQIKEIACRYPNLFDRSLVPQASPTNLALDVKKRKALDKLTEVGTDGQLSPFVLYLIDIGLDMNQIKGIVSRYPNFVHHSLEGKIKPLVEFLLDLGVSPSGIPAILIRGPQLCGISLSANLIPTMAYFEKCGLDKSQWAKVISQFPNLLMCSKQKVKATVDFLYELGLSRMRVGKILTRFPHITSLSIDDNLRPTAEYFRSMGVNLPVLFGRYPQIFSLSIEHNLKHVTQFFLDKGFSIDEIATMASKNGTMYCISLKGNLTPKWEFFLTMDYPRSDLVKFPNYFGYSLEERIKPRYRRMVESGVKFPFIFLLTTANSVFERRLDISIKRMLDA